MTIFMIIALDIVITLCFSNNCSAVICSLTVIFSISREASSETYAPGSIFHHISFWSTIPVSHLLSLQSFTFRSINQKYYFTVYPSILDLTLQITVKGLCKLVFVCAGIRWLVALSPTRLIPWFSKAEGNTYSTLLHHPFLFKGKPTQAQEVAGRIYGAVAGEIYAKPRHNKYPS